MSRSRTNIDPWPTGPSRSAATAPGAATSSSTKCSPSSAGSATPRSRSAATPGACSASASPTRTSAGPSPRSVTTTPTGLGHLNVAAARGALQRVDRAYQAFFRRCKDGGKPGYPRFRSRRRYTTIELTDVTPSQVRQSDTHTLIRINGLPLIRLHRRRPLPDAKPRTIRIVRRGRGVTVDLVYEHQPEALAPNDDAGGIDLGIRKRLTLSTGEHVAPETTDWRKVRRAQRRISRCRRGSRQRRKRAAALARLRRREAVRSRNACHRATSRIVRQFGIIAIEQLAVSRMIRQQLAYKAEWAGRQLVEVDPRYSSQDCSTCGTRRQNPDAREHWTCTECGTTHDRDLNAAVNLLIKAGILALGSRSSGRTAA